MSDYPMLISNKLHSFRNFLMLIYEKYSKHEHSAAIIFPPARNCMPDQNISN